MLTVHGDYRTLVQALSAENGLEALQRLERFEETLNDTEERITE